MDPDTIHAPAGTEPDRTLCGKALRAFSYDIIARTIERFDELDDAGDERCCWECRTML
jgi:hypothetical protein